MGTNFKHNCMNKSTKAFRLLEEAWSIINECSPGNTIWLEEAELLLWGQDESTKGTISNVLPLTRMRDNRNRNGRLEENYISNT